MNECYADPEHIRLVSREVEVLLIPRINNGLSRCQVVNPVLTLKTDMLRMKVQQIGESLKELLMCYASE